MSKERRLVVALALIMFLLALFAFLKGTDRLVFGRVSKNFYEVDEGKFFRSAQLLENELEEVIRDHGIKTLINLHGRRQGEEWWEIQQKTAAKNGVKMIDIKMNSARIPHKQNLQTLLDSFRDDEKPILVHCVGGSDRTGLASALYQIEHMGITNDEAMKMLSTKYFHVELLAPSMKYFLKLYEGRQWAFDVYDPCETEYKYYNRERYCKVTTQHQD